MPGKTIANNVPNPPESKRENTITERLDDIANRMYEIRELSLELKIGVFGSESTSFEGSENKDVSCILDTVEEIEDDQKKTLETLRNINTRL